MAVKPLEVLLSRDDATLLDVLDDRNLFNECKDKNPKLIEYLSRSDTFRQLLDFALGDFADPEVNKPKSVQDRIIETRVVSLIQVFFIALR